MLKVEIAVSAKAENTVRIFPEYGLRLLEDFSRVTVWKIFFLCSQCLFLVN